MRLCTQGEGSTISKSRAFNDCVVLEQEAFDPEAVFMDDIVEDDVLPKLSLAVDGLVDANDSGGCKMDLPSERMVAEQSIEPSTHMPSTKLDPEQLEVYGWESSMWRKIRGYLGF